MEKLKKMVLGPSGAFGLGLGLGACIARLVDDQPVGDAIAIGLVFIVLGTIVHRAVGMIRK